MLDAVLPFDCQQTFADDLILEARSPNYPIPAIDSQKIVAVQGWNSLFSLSGGLNSITITIISTMKDSLPKGLDKVTGLEAESYIHLLVCKSNITIK